MYSYTELTKSSGASAELYMGFSPPSGNRFGRSPFFTYLANVLRMLLHSANRPVTIVAPASAIMVSRPQSSKNGYPAIILLPFVESRFTT